MTQLSTTTNSVDLDSPDDVALADRMNAGKVRIIEELPKTSVGKFDKKVLRAEAAPLAAAQGTAAASDD